LSGLALVSDQQPLKLRIDNHTQGTPAIQLHDEEPSTAWIIVNIGGRAWAQLAYQFGHELGHVFCNSWPRWAQPAPPAQWLEEALAEAFSIRGLALLAASWENKPPFAGDGKFGAAIRSYRDNLIEEYKKATEPDVASWLAIRQANPESRGDKEPSAVLPILAIFEKDQACVEDLGAANRWPERTRVPIEEYLTKWEKSCTEIGAPKRLPGQVRDFLKLGRAL